LWLSKAISETYSSVVSREKAFMNLGDASNFEIFSATIDEEYSATEIERAAEVIGIKERDVLSVKAQRELADWLEENRDEVLAARRMMP
jgi:hypothetical protein